MIKQQTKPKPLGKILGSYTEPVDILDHKPPRVWSYGDNQDGTFYVVGTGTGGPELFPTAAEAGEYAKMRSQGRMHMSALLKLMEMRVNESRRLHQHAKRCPLPHHRDCTP